MPDKPVRVILDTNLWISFLIKKDYSKLDHLLFSGKIVLLFSEELLTEFICVSRRLKFRKYFSESDIEEILEAIQDHAEFITIETSIDICRDSKDNFLLSLSVDGKADYLISGDKDLLDIKTIKKTTISTIADFFSTVITIH